MKVNDAQQKNQHKIKGNSTQNINLESLTFWPNNWSAIYGLKLSHYVSTENHLFLGKSWVLVNISHDLF